MKLGNKALRFRLLEGALSFAKERARVGLMFYFGFFVVKVFNDHLPRKRLTVSEHRSVLSTKKKQTSNICYEGFKL